jgi:hypothetical protein
MLNTHWLRTILLGFLVLPGLMACGGGGGSTSSNVSADGLWEGTITEDAFGPFAVQGLLYNGRIIAISEEGQAIYDGNYTVSGNRLTGTVVIYRINDTILGTANITGTVTEQNTVTLAFSTSYGSTGNISLSFNEIYNRSSSLALINGIWTFTIGADSLTIAIQGDGGYWGQSTDGCIYSGSMGLLNTSRNLYSMETLIQNCGIFNGRYTGFAILYDVSNPNDTLQTVISNSNFIFLLPFTRQ